MSIYRIAILYVIIAIALLAASCSSQSITRDTTCLEYLGFPDQERGAAVRTIGAELGWKYASNPLSGVLDIDYACGSFDNPDAITIGQLIGQFADN